jgi:hypothetical protein
MRYRARAGVTRASSLRGADGTQARPGHGAPPAAAAEHSRPYRTGIGWGGGLPVPAMAVTDRS